MKIGQILMHLTTNIYGDWKLVAGPCMILMKWQYNEICQFLVADIYHF